MTFPVTAPPLPRPVLFDQFWADLTFVHWPVNPESVAHLFPGGTRSDVFADGLTYVSLVPFVMRHTALGTSLRLPYFGSFAETNIRLYSIDDAGRHGVLFRSLETARLAVVGLTRMGLGVPYSWAKMRVNRFGNEVLLRQCAPMAPPRPAQPADGPGRRRGGADAAGGLAHRALGAHTRNAGLTWWVPNEHGPWPLRAAEILELDDDLLSASGVVPAGDRLRALYSTGVHARFGRPSLVR